MAALKLSVLSPERRLVENVDVTEVTLPSFEGQIQILEGHAPMLGALETGVFRYRHPDGQELVGVLSSGFFEVKDGRVSVMAESLVLQGEIDIDQAKFAQKEAEDALRASELDPHQFKKYQLQLQKALVSQQLASHAHE